MLDYITARAYAKINFGLKVLPKREDGFHNIESIFQTIDLYDELTVTPVLKKGCDVICDSIQLPEVNTLTKAYASFCEVTGKEDFGISVQLKKGIPAGGGLGGGSSDAAALIRCLEKLYDIKLNDNQLDVIADKTGSDVFFFMHCDQDGRGCALVSGRGEIIKKIAPRNDIYLLLILPGVNSSTKEAYSLVDKAFEDNTAITSPDFAELENIYRKSIDEWTFTNTFTPVIAGAYKEVCKAIKDLKETGCCYAEMSGSGSTVFGAFTVRQQAIKARVLLEKAWVCKLIQTV